MYSYRISLDQFVIGMNQIKQFLKGRRRFAADGDLLSKSERSSLDENTFNTCLSSRGIICDPAALQQLAIVAAGCHAQSVHRSSSLPAARAVFDSWQQYGVDEVEAAGLISGEISRLMTSIPSNVQEATILPFSSMTSDRGFRTMTEVSAIADQILCNFTICQYDNEVLFMGSGVNGPCLPEVESLALRHRRSLQERLSSANPQHHPKRLEGNNNFLYNAVVDHVTSSATKLCVESVASESFRANLIACLARIAAKLKHLNNDPVKYAEICLSTNTGTMDGKLEESRPGPPVHRHTADENPSWSTDPERLFSRSLGNNGDPEQNVYYLEMIDLRLCLMPILIHMVSSLRGSFSTSPEAVRGTDSLEATTVVYEAGLSTHSILINQNADGEIQAASSAPCLAVCDNAFRALVRTAESIRHHHTLPVAKPSALDQRRWSFEWQYLELTDTGAAYEGCLQSDDIDIMVSILIPLACTSSLVASQIVKMLYLASAQDHRGLDFTPSSRPRFVALSTLKAGRRNLSCAPGSDANTMPLYASALARRSVFHNQFTRPKWWKKTVNNDGIPLGWVIGSAERQAARQLDEKIRRQWEVHQDCIKCSCVTYVLTVLAIVLIVIAGATAFGYLARDRIDSYLVEPVSMFLISWGVSGTIIVASKTMKADLWPWADYFRFKLPCKSVTQLSSASGIHPQVILNYLLHNEESTILWTIAPFNGQFRKNTSGIGFSIDVKQSVRSLILSGLVLVKVATMEGPVLMCLRIPRETHFVGLLPSSRAPGRTESKHDEKQMMCFDIPQLNRDQWHREAEIRGSLDLKIQRKRLDWFRILGVFNNLDSTTWGNTQASRFDLNDPAADLKVPELRDRL